MLSVGEYDVCSHNSIMWTCPVQRWDIIEWMICVSVTDHKMCPTHLNWMQNIVNAMEMIKRLKQFNRFWIILLLLIHFIYRHLMWHSRMPYSETIKINNQQSLLQPKYKHASNHIKVIVTKKMGLEARFENNKSHFFTHPVVTSTIIKDLHD